MINVLEEGQTSPAAFMCALHIIHAKDARKVSNNFMATISQTYLPLLCLHVLPIQMRNVRQHSAIYTHPDFVSSNFCTRPRCADTAVSVYLLFKLTVKTRCKMVQESEISCPLAAATHAPPISKFKFRLLAKNHLVQFILNHMVASETSLLTSQIRLYFRLI